jgi:hypothetical protein
MSFDLDQLGEVSGAWDAIDATLDTLRVWLPAMALKVNDAGYDPGDGGMVAPMTYGSIPLSQTDINPDQLPAVYVSSPGSVGDPIQVQEDGWSVWYTVNVVVVDRADTWDHTAERAQVWAALVRQTMLGQITLRGKVSRVKWAGERYNAVPEAAGRTMAGAQCDFRVLIPVSALGDFGPLTPDPVIPDPATGVPNPLADPITIIGFEEDYEPAP